MLFYTEKFDKQTDLFMKLMERVATSPSVSDTDRNKGNIQ